MSEVGLRREWNPWFRTSLFGYYFWLLPTGGHKIMISTRQPSRHGSKVQFPECAPWRTLDPRFESHQCLYVYYKYINQKKAQFPCRPSSVSRCFTRGESEESIAQSRKHTSKRSTLALKLRADITRSPKQWPHKNDSCPPDNFFEKIFSCHFLTSSNPD